MRLSGWKEETSLIIDILAFHIVAILSWVNCLVINESLGLVDILHFESD